MPASARDQRRVAQRRARVLQLRAAGATFQQIADAEGLATASAAVMDVRRALDATGAALAVLAEQHVTLELERLDSAERAAQNVLRGAAQQGANHDPDLVLRSIDRLVRISARRSSLLGLDASPERHHGPPPQAQSRRDELARKRRDRRTAAAAG
jgi:hypothetical protein